MEEIDRKKIKKYFSSIKKISYYLLRYWVKHAMMCKMTGKSSHPAKKIERGLYA